MLEGKSAILALNNILSGDKSPDEIIFKEQAFERLRCGMLDNNLSTSDRLVRFRQAIRYATIILGVDSLLLPHTNDWGDKNKYEEFGLRLRPPDCISRTMES